MVMLQELLAAATTWFVIDLAREITERDVTVGDFLWIIFTQTASYLAGAASWVFAEYAGFAAFGRYLLHFARLNRFRTGLLGDSQVREGTEPFLTNETFRVCFDLIYDLQFYLRLFFNIAFNAVVLGVAIDGNLPLAYVVAFAVLLTLQWFLRRPLANAYLINQRMTNRMMARTYNFWDNVFSGNRYNRRLWFADFRERLGGAMQAQVRAILAREGWSAASGFIALIVVLAATAWVAVHEADDTALLVALAATLPRQIEMTLDMHQLTAGMTDLLAIWTRIGGICEHLRPAATGNVIDRVQFGRVSLRHAGQEHAFSDLGGVLRALSRIDAGRVAIRGANGTGKSALLLALKSGLRGQAYYLPTHDRLNFRFNTGIVQGEPESATDEEAPEPEEIDAEEQAQEKLGYSSGERQLKVLDEIVARTDARIYLLDEWDANLDAANRAIASRMVDKLAERALVVEISHRDAH